MIQPKSAQMEVIKEEAEMKQNVQDKPKKGFFGSVKNFVSFGAKKEAAAVSSEEEDDQMNRSMEDVDSDELDGDMNLSDNEEEACNFRNVLKAKKSNESRRKYR